VTENRSVGGSIPPLGTILLSPIKHFLEGGAHVALDVIFGGAPGVLSRLVTGRQVRHDAVLPHQLSPIWTANLEVSWFVYRFA
jgi:hypothetical protein